MVEEHVGSRHQNKSQIHQWVMSVCTEAGTSPPWAQWSWSTIATVLRWSCLFKSQAPSENDVGSR